MNTISGGGSLSVNGLRARGYNFSIDGVDASPDSKVERASFGRITTAFPGRITQLSFRVDF